MLGQLVLLVVGLELVSTQGTCNSAVPVCQNDSSTISNEEISQALDEVNTALFDAVCTLCQIRGRLENSKPPTNRDVVPRDCQDVFDQGNRTTDVYMIYPPNRSPIQVRCDQTTDGGGWTVIQRRVSNSTDFYRTWHDYKDGFGELDGNFWLGNDNIHTLTASGNYSLRVDLTNEDGDSLYANYNSFSVANEASKYRLTLFGYTGTAGDAMAFQNGSMFSTKDEDNDEHDVTHCAADYHGGWWYSACYHANPNGQYGVGRFDLTGIRWFPWKYVTKIDFKLKRI